MLAARGFGWTQAGPKRVASRTPFHFAAGSGGFLIVATQKDPSTEEPGLAQLYPIACITRVVRVVDARREGKQAIVVGLLRARLVAVDSSDPALRVRIEPLPDVHEPSVELETARVPLDSIRPGAPSAPPPPPPPPRAARELETSPISSAAIPTPAATPAALKANPSSRPMPAAPVDPGPTE